MTNITPLRRLDDGQQRSRGSGRPSKYEPWMCEVAEEVLARGPAFTLISVAAGLDVAPSTVSKWITEHPDFSDAVQRGRAKGVCIGEMYLDQMMRFGAAPGAFNALQLGLMNRVRALHGLGEEWLNPKQRQDAGEAAVESEGAPDLSRLSGEELAELERLRAKLVGQPTG